MSWSGAGGTAGRDIRDTHRAEQVRYRGNGRDELVRCRRNGGMSRAVDAGGAAGRAGKVGADGTAG